jgi:hypothetical protein
MWNENWLKYIKELEEKKLLKGGGVYQDSVKSKMKKESLTWYEPQCKIQGEKNNKPITTTQPIQKAQPIKKAQQKIQGDKNNKPTTKQPLEKAQPKIDFDAINRNLSTFIK